MNLKTALFFFLLYVRLFVKIKDFLLGVLERAFPYFKVTFLVTFEAIFCSNNIWIFFFYILQQWSNPKAMLIPAELREASKGPIELRNVKFLNLKSEISNGIFWLSNEKTNSIWWNLELIELGYTLFWRLKYYSNL